MSDSTEKPRGLWNLMSQQPDTEQQEEQVTDETDATPSPAAESAPPASEPDVAPKGLWAVMNQPADVIDEDTDSDEVTTNSADEDTADESAEQPAPRGLWGVMSSTPHAASADEVEEDSEEDDTETPTDPDPDVEEESTQSEVATDLSALEPVEVNLPLTTDEKPAYQRLQSRSGRSKKATAACLAGLFATPLAALALLPEAWLRLPATAVGFVALMLGLLGWQDVRSSRGRQTGTEFAFAGIVLGILAMFLGPVVFARVGQGYRKSFGRQQTITNLETVGTALQSHHSALGQYPAGGIFQADQNNEQQAMHGWMTTLLPYLGEEQLHSSIQLNVPFDAPANRTAMQQKVSSYLAAGALEDGIGRHKMAPAHFAGVGGELHIEGVGLVKVGIFGRNSDTTREDITDGLSQTFVAGEISAFYPAWGEPENWRMIGRGLNRDSAGFGNAAGTGALFLRADGSVKFYTNETDPTLLRKLSTLNAGDIVSQ